MDEQKLAELFRAAATEADAPPAAFDHDDVLAGSRRLARRQKMVASVVVAAVCMIGAGTIVAGLVVGDPGQSSTLAQEPSSLSAPNAPQQDPAQQDPAQQNPAQQAAPPGAPGPALDQAAPPGAPGSGALDQAAPKAAPEAGLAAPEASGPSGRSKSLAAPALGCAQPDARVFTELTGVLPAVRDASPYPVPGGCGPADTGVAVNVTDPSGARGTLVVVLTPSGADTRPPDGPTGISATARARSGGQLRVTAGSDGGPVPYRAQLEALTSDLAGRL